MLPVAAVAPKYREGYNLERVKNLGWIMLKRKIKNISKDNLVLINRQLLPKS